MSIEIREVQSKNNLKEFIYLPEKIHRNHKNWVPPIYMDDWTFFNPKKNKSFGYCDTILAIAYKNDLPVGRIMGIINHKYNEGHNEKDARFCFMETYEDQEVFHLLIEFIADWARSRNQTNLVLRPLGFSDKDPQGFMVEGFGEPIVIATNGNQEYMPKLLEQEGFAKKVDCVVYKLSIPSNIPPFYEAIYNRALQKNNINILEFKKRSNLKPYIRPVLRLLNETFSDIYAFVPFTDREMDDFANRYLLLLDPNFIKIITDKQNNILSFIIGMPDISKGIIAAGGKLLPFGIFKIIKSRKNTKQLNLLLGGIRPDYRGQGLDVIMGVKMLESAHRKGLEYIDSHLELETNTKMRMEMEKMGGIIYKRYRIFQRKL